MTTLDPTAEGHLRRAIALAVEAREHGDQPFGAVLVAADGTVLAEGLNAQVTTGDLSAHAELVAVREAGMRLGVPALAGSTMYASGEPCPMCAAGMYYASVGRVVFGASVTRIRQRRRDQRTPMPVRVHDVLRDTAEVVGPVLEDEAIDAFPQPPGS